VLDVVPDSRLVVLDGCGHCPQVQRPAEIADLLVTLAREDVAA
jgi:pimeloyl-ACP methyl ester carboxylesterase